MRLSLGLLCALFLCVSSYKILIYNPKFGISHVTFAGKIADTLAGAGHEVVSLLSIKIHSVNFVKYIFLNGTPIPLN